MLPATYKSSKGCVIIMLIVTFGRWGKNKFEKLKKQFSKICWIPKTWKNWKLDVDVKKYSMNLHLPNGEISQSLTPSCTASKAVWGEYSATLFSKHLVTILSWKLSKVEIKIVWRIFGIHFGSFTTPSKTWTWFFSRVEKSEDDTIKSNRLWLEDIHP